MTPKEIEANISFRLMKKEDEPFIFSSWLKSFYDGSIYCRNISKSTFYKFHHKIVEAVFKRPSTVISIATPKDEPDIIVGYIVYEKLESPLLHYLYVKEPFRKDGIGRYLVENVSQLTLKKLMITHITERIESHHYEYEFNYCPYLM